MGKEAEYLLDWEDRFFRNRDIILRKIKEIKRVDDHLEIHYKEKLVKGYAGSTLMDALNRISDKEEYCAIAVFNSNDNFKEMVANWNILTSYPKLTIYFVNEDSLQDKQWVIMPAIHNRIADPDSLKRGLKSMFSAVDPLSSSRIKKVINSG